MFKLFVRIKRDSNFKVVQTTRGEGQMATIQVSHF